MWRFFRLILWVIYFIDLYICLYIICHDFENNCNIICFFVLDAAINCCYFLGHQPGQLGVNFLCPLVAEVWHFYCSFIGCFNLSFYLWIFLFTRRINIWSYLILYISAIFLLCFFLPTLWSTCCRSFSNLPALLGNIRCC